MTYYLLERTLQVVLCFPSSHNRRARQVCCRHPGRKMEISPVILEGQHVRLEPLSAAHEESLIAAASDGELWNSTVTIVPSSPATMIDYIRAALNGQAQGRELPFVIIRKSSSKVAGTTRFYEIR